MIIYGTRLFGEVDKVPGIFAVRTRFFHVNFLPLFPTASFLMFGPDRGVELTSVQWRSVLACWGRVGLIVAGGIALIAGAAGWSDRTGNGAAVGELVIGALCGAAIWASYRYSRASKKRALELCAMAALNEDTKGQIERHFGRAGARGAEVF